MFTYEWTGIHVRKCDYDGPHRQVAVYQRSVPIVPIDEEPSDLPICVTYRVEEAHILRDKTLQKMFPGVWFGVRRHSDARLYLPQGEPLQPMHMFAVAVEMDWLGAAGVCVQIILDALFGWL